MSTVLERADLFFDYRPRVSAGKPPLSSRGVKKLAERERTVGLEPDDAAAKWLEEHDPPTRTEPPKAARKSKTLHRWRQRQARGDS